MRRSLILAALAFAPACSTTTPSPSISDSDLRDPKAEFDVLRSLAGEWVARGRTTTDPFDVRFLVLDGGFTVNAVLLGGGSKDAVLTYFLNQDQDQITMIQRPSGGESLSMPGEPIHTPVMVETDFSGTWDPKTSTYERSGPGREVSRKPDPSLHMLEFKPTDPAQVDWPQAGRLARAMLIFSPEGGVGLVWFYADTVIQYQLMRKHPPGVERSADQGVPPPSVQDKMNRHFDLRDDPAYKDEAH